MTRKIDDDSLKSLIKGFKKKRILVIGDLVVDRYIEGEVVGISPEAPVPLIEQNTDKLVLGGAANVVRNIKGLGGDVYVSGVVGGDSEGRYVIDDLKRDLVDTAGILIVENMVTSSSTRIVANQVHQLLRIDRNPREEIGKTFIQTLTHFINENVDLFDGFVISDHGKGIITPDIMSLIVNAADGKKPIIVKPKKKNFTLYRQVSVVTPNRKEACDYIGMKALNETSIRNAGYRIMNLLDAEAVLITWIEDGFHLFERNGEPKFFKSEIDHIADLTGYWDAVSGVLVLSLACGASMEEATIMALRAAEVVANEPGIVPINLETLLSRIKIHGEMHD